MAAGLAGGAPGHGRGPAGGRGRKGPAGQLQHGPQLVLALLDPSQLVLGLPGPQVPAAALPGRGVEAALGALEHAQRRLEAAVAAVDQPQVLQEPGHGADLGLLGQLLPGGPEVVGLGVDLGHDARVEGVGQPVAPGLQELGVEAGVGPAGGGRVPGRLQPLLGELPQQLVQLSLIHI